MAIQTQPASPTGTPPTQAVAAQPSASATGKPAALVPASASVPRFGGNRGGKARKDGLAPGSLEALEADKKKDRERKQASRAESAKLVEPPPLPSAGASGANPVPASADSVVAGVAVSVPAVIVPWRADLLKPVTDQAIDALEESRVKKFCDGAREAKIPEAVVKQIGRDAAYPSDSKAMMKLATPEVAAKYLNKLGISADNQYEITLVTAVLRSWFQGNRLEAKLQELIETAKEHQRQAQQNANVTRPLPPVGQPKIQPKP